MNPELDLSIHRVIRAPRKAVWKAWTNPDSLAQWWIPSPMLCRVERLKVRPGGAFVTKMSADDGRTFVPHMDACFLVLTNAVDSRWRPASPAPVAMTAEVTMTDHAEGTDYRIVARHADPAARDRHIDLGFADGWGTVADQLAGFAESSQ